MSSDHPPFGPHYSATNVTAKWLIETAYDLKDFQLSGAPGWISTRRYDVEADIGAPTLAQIRELSRDEQYDQLKVLMQSLLADRFTLRVVRAVKQFAAYNLAVSKDDSKLKSFAVDPYPANAHGLYTLSDRGNGEMCLEASKANLENIANGLSRALALPVIDKTSVKGNYTFAIRWTNDAQAPGGPPPDPAYDRTVTAALEDVGLKLIHTKVPTNTITIVQIEEPSPN